MPPILGRRRPSRRRGTKAWERYEIIRRAAAYFGREIDEDRAWESARSITAEELRNFLRDLGPGPDFRFSGRFYTVRGSELEERGSWDEVREAVAETARVWGESAVRALEILMGATGGLTEREFSARLKVEGVPYSREFLRWLLDVGLAVKVPDGRICGLEEARKPVKDAIEELKSEYRRMDPAARSEMPEIMRMEAEFQAVLREVLERGIDEVLEFGRGFSSTALAERLRSTFGDLLYYDVLLAIAQQYSIADAPVVSAATGTVTMRTGFNLALFGEPGTGKSFSIATMILGDERRAIPPHGLPGRNRYCGGMTPAKFIRLGQAYEGLKYNFIVPEFNDWFRYRGMVEALKLAMEHGTIRYETARRTIGPYRFTCFLSVAYNTRVGLRGYEVTVSDPNFNAIEERMLCRLHRMTKERYVEIAKKQMEMALGRVRLEGSETLRAHLTLVHAAETGHPLVRGRLAERPVVVDEGVYEAVSKARDAVLSEIPGDRPGFSPRLEIRAIQLASALALMRYFAEDSEDPISVDDGSLKLAIRFYVEEAAVRSRELFDPSEVLAKLGAGA